MSILGLIIIFLYLVLTQDGNSICAMPLIGLTGTSFATGDNLTAEVWSAKLFKQALKEIFFKKFTGKEATNIIQTKTDLLKDVGDKITFGLIMKLTGDGRKDDEKMETFEEALTYHDFKTTIHLRENGVIAAGKMSMRRTAFNIKTDAKTALGGWMAELIDEDIVCALSGVANSIGTLSANAPSTNRKWKGGQTEAGVVSRVSTDALIVDETAYLFGEAVISVVKRMAEMASPKILPIVVNGQKYYMFLASPFQIKALRASDDWAQANREAGIRGKENVIFSAADSIWDGVVVHSYERIKTRLGAGGSATSEYFEADDVCYDTVHVARGLFLGAQAGVLAWGQYPKWYEKNFEYGRVPGVMTDCIMSADKPDFDGEDFGVIIVDTAYVPDE